MSVNHYFQSGTTIGRNSEQLLHEDLIIECLKIYGFEVFYLPRTTVNLDKIFNEDPLNLYKQCYPLEMYLTDIDGLLSAMHFEEEDENGKELYPDEEYEAAQKYHTDKINRELPDWSKY